MKKKEDVLITPKAVDQYKENTDEANHRRGFITGAGTLGVAGLSMAALSSTLISNYALAEQSPENTIDNIDALKSVSPSFGGQIYFLLGHTVNGIGGGLWYYDPVDTTSENDDIRVVIALNEARMKRVDTSNLTLDQCGCIPDYADNTYDNSEVLAKLFNNEDINSVIISDNSQYRFESDVRVLRNNLTISGAGIRSNLQGRGNARIILGEAIGGGGLNKSGTKVVGINFNNIGIKPQGNHSNEAVLLDYADDVKFNNCNIGSYVNDNGSSFETGVVCRWVQWIYFNETVIDVNGHCVEIRLENTLLRNEDHFHFTNCRLYNSKTHSAGTFPAAIAIVREAGNNYSIFEFSMKGCHLGKFGPSLRSADEPVETSGIKLVNQSGGSTVRTFHAATINGCFFENVDFPLDFKREAPTRDDVRISIDGTSFLQGNTVFHGQNINAHRVSLSNVSVTQFTHYANNVRCHFIMGNNIISVSDPLPNGVSRHRFASKASNASLQGYRLAFSGQVSVEANANQVTVTHNLSSPPSIFTVNPLNSAWIAPYAITDINDETFKIRFNDRPTEQRSLRWSAEVQEI